MIDTHMKLFARLFADRDLDVEQMARWRAYFR
eukprot:COSAG05_NODE_1412_length_4957_cov_50.130918_4_plen_32_part_00